MDESETVEGVEASEPAVETPPTSDDVVARLASFRAGGGAAFDPPALAMIAGLVERGAALGTAARARLEARALERLIVLERQLAVAQSAARARLDELAGGEAPRGPLAEAFAAGDLMTVLWHAPRHARVAARPPQPPPRSDAARTKFRATAAEAKSVVTLAKAERALPEASGPYNGLSLAVRALRELSDLSPAYVATYLARLEDLASLAVLPAPAKGARAGGRRRR